MSLRSFFGKRVIILLGTVVLLGVVVFVGLHSQGQQYSHASGPLMNLNRHLATVRLRDTRFQGQVADLTIATETTTNQNGRVEELRATVVENNAVQGQPRREEIVDLRTTAQGEIAVDVNQERIGNNGEIIEEIPNDAAPPVIIPALGGRLNGEYPERVVQDSEYHDGFAIFPVPGHPDQQDDRLQIKNPCNTANSAIGPKGFEQVIVPWANHAAVQLELGKFFDNTSRLKTLTDNLPKELNKIQAALAATYVQYIGAAITASMLGFPYVAAVVAIVVSASATLQQIRQVQILLQNIENIHQLAVTNFNIVMRKLGKSPMAWGSSGAISPSIYDALTRIIRIY